MNTIINTSKACEFLTVSCYLLKDTLTCSGTNLMADNNTVTGYIGGRSKNI